MKILFVGLLFNEESLSDAYRYCKCGVQMAPHLYQKRLLDGFKKCDDIDLSVINLPPIGSFPIHYKKLFSRKAVSGDDLQIGFINLPFLKYKLQVGPLYRAIKKKLDAKGNCEIIFYSLHEPFLKVANKIKKKYPNTRITLIQTDAVPGRSGMLKSKRAVRLGNKLVKLARVVDNFILLSEELVFPLEVENRPYILAECIADANQRMSVDKEAVDNIFLYTGTTQKEYGITELVDAFSCLPEAQLWICGSGNADEYIRKKAEAYKNIKHFGILGQKEIADLRDRCDFLINPRRPSGTYTRYSFPSKTAEYMMSGKPTVMYRLEAIPREYDQYLIYLSGDTPESIADELREMIRSDYSRFKEMGQDARQFMMENKTGDTQAKRIFAFLQATDITKAKG